MRVGGGKLATGGSVKQNKRGEHLLHKQEITKCKLKRSVEENHTYTSSLWELTMRLIMLYVM